MVGVIARGHMGMGLPGDSKALPFVCLPGCALSSVVVPGLARFDLVGVQ
jgi:hypothetical protein